MRTSSCGAVSNVWEGRYCWLIVTPSPPTLTRSILRLMTESLRSPSRLTEARQFSASSGPVASRTWNCRQQSASSMKRVLQLHGSLLLDTGQCRRTCKSWPCYRLFADLAVMPAVMSHERSKTGREVIWLIYCILEAADGHLRIRPKSDHPILLLLDSKIMLHLSAETPCSGEI